MILWVRSACASGGIITDCIRWRTICVIQGRDTPLSRNVKLMFSSARGREPAITLRRISARIFASESTLFTSSLGSCVLSISAVRATHSAASGVEASSSANW